jgi:predicted Zn-dependent peptidase
MAAPRMVASVVGRVDLDAVAARLEDGLAALPAARPVPAAAPPAPAAGESAVSRRRDVKTAWLVIGYPAPSGGHPDAAPLAVYASVLGGSMDSRLFTELRDKRGLAYELGALYAGYVGPAFLAAYIGTRAERAEEARAGLKQEVERLRDLGPTPEEVARARNYLRGSQLMAHERNANQASTYGIYELFGLGYDYADRFLAALDAVTPERVREVAVKWLDRPSEAMVLPAEEGAASPAGA